MSMLVPWCMQEHEVVEGGAALGDPPQTEPHALYDDCIREVLNLLNVRQQCVASCVSKRCAHTDIASTTHDSHSSPSCAAPHPGMLQQLC